MNKIKKLPRKYRLFGIEDKEELQFRRALAIQRFKIDNPLMISKSDFLEFQDTLKKAYQQIEEGETENNEEKFIARFENVMRNLSEKELV